MKTYQFMNSSGETLEANQAVALLDRDLLPNVLRLKHRPGVNDWVTKIERFTS